MQYKIFNLLFNKINVITYNIKGFLHLSSLTYFIDLSVAKIGVKCYPSGNKAPHIHPGPSATIWIGHKLIQFCHCGTHRELA